MARDVIRKENVKRYIHTALKPKTASNFVSQNLPMAAMFLKNKALSWACLFIAVQNYLNDPYVKDPSDESTNSAYKIIFALVALGTAYLDLIFPQVGGFVPSAAETVADVAAEAAIEVAETVAAAI
ncbi:hypothetical protein C6P40_005201 [Pichia californica]|uniref:Uncharacterized protein n=1 Tax=Pichia californica TaxID=460514 RepID=A0A9P7BFW4_9ASCO|nr:hypothetical protein C6P42_005460 [[Candida] californica]KAG0689341.1 hypothetical protein C6P40_005201 [[Candida] californica]